MRENQPSSSTRSNIPLAYFALAYGFSWIVEIPLALANQGITRLILPAWTHYLAGYGPMLAALLVISATEGRIGLERLWSRLTAWHVGMLWWVAAISPLLIGLVVIAALNLFGAQPVALAELGEVNFLPALGVGALPLWILTFGLGEELGWRGFALPRLQHGRSALEATAILALFWALWHLPTFFYLYDPGIVIGWALGLFSGAMVFTWLFNSTGGSVLMAAVWHGCLNFITGSAAGKGLVAAIVSSLVMVWAVVVLLVYKPASLSRRPKVVD